MAGRAGWTFPELTRGSEQQPGRSQAAGLGPPCSIHRTPCLLSFHALHMDGGHGAGPLGGERIWRYLIQSFYIRHILPIDGDTNMRQKDKGLSRGPSSSGTQEGVRFHQGRHVEASQRRF